MSEDYKMPSLLEEIESETASTEIEIPSEDLHKNMNENLPNISPCPISYDRELYSNTYGHTFICSNCQHKNDRRIKKGIKIPGGIICNNCGCETNR